MNFSTPARVATTIQNLKDADIRTDRAKNRALVNSLYNGDAPWTSEEARQNNIQVNVNWQEGTDLILQGREQYENAFLSSDLFFKVHVPLAPKHKRTLIEGELTRLVNKLLKANRPYLHTQRMKWASVVMHGKGPQMWEDQWKWNPYFVGIDDLLIPTDTDLTFENLNHFPVRRKMTPGQLFRKTIGRPESKRDPNWNIKLVTKVLDEYKDLNDNPNHYNWHEHPEKMVELWKQNVTSYDTDGVPTIWMWDFYHQEDDDERPCWYRKILLDTDCAGYRDSQKEIEYLYSSEQPFADSLDHILHVQFSDGNNVAPFMYHSVRSLGVRLFDPVHMLNRTRCQFLQKTFQDMMDLFRVLDPTDRSRLDQIFMGLMYGVFPDGLNFVTREQRYSPDPKLVEMQLANLKQLIGEGSQQYTQDIDTGTNKERTAFEVSTLLNQTTKLTGSMLNLAYLQETFGYKEICRRLTLKGTQDWDAKKFQNDCKEAGIDEKWVNADRWEIEPVRVLGSGNAQLEAAQARALMEVRPLMNPEAQNEVLHDYVFATTHDPRRANRLAPLDGAPKVTDTTHDTELAFGALMQGVQVQPKPGLNPIEVVETMLRLMSQEVMRIMQSGGMGTPQKVSGLFLSEQYIQQWIAQLAQDDANKQRVKQYMDVLGRLMNEVKAMAQRLQEAMQKQAESQQMDPETMQKLQANQAMNQQKMAMSQQKMVQQEQKHRQKMAQTNQKFAAQQQQQTAKAMSQIHQQSIQSGIQAGQPKETPSE